MMKKLLVTAAAGAMALGGMAVAGAGGAGAAKPVLSGTLHCNVSSLTTFSPAGVLTAAQLPKGKNKKAKVNTTTTATGCTGSEPSSGLPVPTGWTSTSKTKSVGHLCGDFTSLPGGKTKYVIGGGVAKSKGGLPGTSETKADNGTPNNDADNVTIPPTSDPGFNAFLVAHGNDSLITIGSGGTLAGKAYAGKVVSSRSVAGSIISKIGPCAGAGLASVTATGTEGWGVPA